MEWDTERCAGVFRRELELLRKIARTQEEVRQAVLERQWVDFDFKLAENGRYGLEFEDLEAERGELLEALAARFWEGGRGVEPDRERTFYALLTGLPEEERRELAGLYRELKRESLVMRALNDSFLRYLEEARTMSAACLDALFPSRGGGLYTRRGAQASREMTSMVFNCRV